MRNPLRAGIKPIMATIAALRAIRTAFLSVLLAAPLADAAQKYASVYTDLDPEACKTVEFNDEEAGWYVGECVGVAGYTLELVEADIRQTLNVIAPNGNQTELDLWTYVSGAFSSLGDTAEWRVARDADGRDIPVALIVRYNTNEDGENPDRKTSRLVVVKLVGDEACIVDVIQPVKHANREARKVADNVGVRACAFGDVGVDTDDPDLIVAEFFSESGGQLISEWRTFDTPAQLEAAREVQESYFIAYVWLSDASVIQINTTRFSESGDWVEYTFETYRADGSLERINNEVRSFMGDVIINVIRTYDASGNLVRTSTRYRDLMSGKQLPPREYLVEPSAQSHLVVTESPFYPHIAAARGDNTLPPGVAEMVPSGWTPAGFVLGDLNGDSMADAVVQLKRADGDSEEGDWRIMVFFRSTNDRWQKKADSTDLILCSICGGSKGGNGAHLHIKSGVLTVDQIYGSSSGTSFLLRFRYEPRSGRFRLIGEDVSQYQMTSSEDTSTNLLTGRQIVTRRVYDESTGDFKVVSENTRSVKKTRKYLEDVRYSDY